MREYIIHQLSGVVEVIKLNRIIDLCMTLDFDVQRIYGLEQIS